MMSENFQKEMKEVMGFLEEMTNAVNKRTVHHGRMPGKLLRQVQAMIIAIRLGRAAVILSPDFVVMSKDYYDELMNKVRPKIEPEVWIDDAHFLEEDE
jgi:hypothetical protein